MAPAPIYVPARYNQFSINLRSSYRSYYSAPLATNRATHSLYNSSTLSTVVLPRVIGYNGFPASPLVTLATVQGPVGSDSGNENPLWPGQPSGVGLHFYADTTTVFPQQVFLSNAPALIYFGVSAMPFAVLLPGWSLVVQNNAVAGTVQLSFVWEELDINDPMLGNVIA